MNPLVKPELQKGIADLLHTETLLPRPRKKPDVPEIGVCELGHFGNTVLLVIPTENDDKVKILKAWFKELKPEGVNIHTVVVNVETGVGQQPYDEAGLDGARNRIKNALAATPKLVNIQEEGIGTIIVASIENHILKTDLDRPADYGMIIVHNATTGKTDATLSQGVTVPVPYLEHAQTFGYEDSAERHGKVTVGAVLAANVKGIKAADWHEVVVGVQRYHILKEAMKVLDNPMATISGSNTT